MKVECLRIVSNDLDNIQHIQIAKIELVENEWKEMGLAHTSDLNDLADDNDNFSVEVINTDESLEYGNSLNSLDDLIRIENFVKIVHESIKNKGDILIGTHGQMTPAYAIRLAKKAKKYLPKHSPGWIRAEDIIIAAQNIERKR